MPNIPSRITIGVCIPRVMQARLLEMCLSKRMTISDYLRACVAQHINDLNHKALKAHIDTQDVDHISDKDKKRIEIKMTDSEFELLNRFMQTYGLTRQQAIAYCLRHSLANTPLITNEQILQLRDATDELRRVGINLNQIAYVFNSQKANHERLKEKDIDEFFALNEQVQAKITAQIQEIHALVKDIRARPDLTITMNKK